MQNEIIKEEIKRLETEAKNMRDLAETLEYDHQRETKITLIRKANILEECAKELIKEK
jgi:hypothetical protein